MSVGGTGTPKDRDEVNKREFYVCDGECVILTEQLLCRRYSISINP
jgi:hypothetical protein